MRPAQYWRENKQWREWLGRIGSVVVTTKVYASSSALSDFLPYSYVLVDFGDVRREFMGVDHQEFEVGDSVECVLRKVASTGEEELIAYGIKVRKIRK